MLERLRQGLLVAIAAGWTLISLTILVNTCAIVDSQRAEEEQSTRERQVSGPNQSLVAIAWASSASIEQDARDPSDATTPQPEQFLERCSLETATWLIAAFTLLTGVAAFLTYRIYDAMHATVKTVERAYLGVRTIILETVSPDKPLHMIVSFTNSGNLPAQLIGDSKRMFVGEPLPESFTFKDWNRTGGMIPPRNKGKSRSDFEDDLKFSQAQWDSIVAGKLEMHIIGAFRYRDGFGEIRETGYGFTYRADMTSIPETRFVFSQNASYNYMK